MNISYNWLKRYIDLDMSPEKTAEVLTSIGLETGGIEEVESIKGGLKGIVIGRVITCEEHPNSDHLHITTVDLGDGNGPTQIVCGAPNVAAGQTVVVATVGTTLYDGDKEFQIKKSKIRGVESFGMICAEDEIGVGTSHDGIIVIDTPVAPGTPAADYYNLSSDYVLEVDLTPNRIDAASHYGVARDLAAWIATHADKTPLISPDVDAFKVDKTDGAVPVEVLDYNACPRYSGLTIRNIKVKESPEWLQKLLIAVGQRPINNIVDITNFILLGLGQPLHCFDLAKVKGEKIIVRKCADGTPFTTLDGIDRKLSDADLMICDGNGDPMCLAGVFGGLDSGVTETTTDIFLESAYFNPTSIRKSARRHGLNTDASFRYERGTDPNATLYCLKVAALLVKELAGGEICGQPVDIYPQPVNPFDVDITYKYLNDLIGKDIPADTVKEIVTALEMDITSATDKGLSLKVPTYRVDVQRPCDVAEDILRIYGYNNVEISNELHATLSYKTLTDTADSLAETISNQLTAIGFNEILNNSLTAAAHCQLVSDDTHQPVQLLNPLSTDLNALRMSLMFGGLETIAHNSNRRMPDLSLYEFGSIYSANPSIESTSENPIAPYTETRQLALWMTGLRQQPSWNMSPIKASIYDMKAIVANIIARLGINSRELELKADNSNPLLSSALALATRNGKQLGTIGVVAKSVLKRFDIKEEVVYAELDWKSLVKLAVKTKVSYTPLPRTQPVKRDLALLIDKTVTMAQIEKVVRDSEKRLLREVSLFDVYEGKNLPEGKKSYAINIILQDDEKTLQDKQIDAVMQKIITNLTRQLGVSLR